MPGSLFRSLRESDHIFIRFLPADPTMNHPEAWDWPILLDPLGSIFLSCFIISITIIGIAIITYLYRERRLVREGRPSVGVVTTCKPKNRTFWVEYGFRTEDGRSIDGSGYSSDPQENGSSICVLNLPRNPSQSNPYPLPNFYVVD